LLQFADKPWIVASASGEHLTFNSQFPFVVSSRNGGATWTAPLALLSGAQLDPYYYYYAGGGGTLSDGTAVLLHIGIPTK
jgi:hypothetical protein